MSRSDEIPVVVSSRNGTAVRISDRVVDAVADRHDDRRERLLAAVGPIAILVYDETDDNGRKGPPGRPMTPDEYIAPVIHTIEQLEKVTELARKVGR